MKMHNPNIPAKAFIGKSHLGNYSDAMLELDSNIGKVIDAIQAESPDTIVIITADNARGRMPGRTPLCPLPREKARRSRRIPRARHHVGTR